MVTYTDTASVMSSRGRGTRQRTKIRVPIIRNKNSTQDTSYIYIYIRGYENLERTLQGPYCSNKYYSVIQTFHFFFTVGLYIHTKRATY